MSDGDFVFPSGFIGEAIGLKSNDKINLGLKEFGFTSFVDTADGFTACVSTSPRAKFRELNPRPL